MGAERFQGLGNAFFRGSDAFVLVYDVTNPKSFENLSHWRQAFFDQSGIADTGDFPCVILGNKVDRTDERVVSQKRADEWARQQQVPHHEVSAKEATNVEKAFYDLARICLENLKEDAMYVPLSPSSLLRVAAFFPPASPFCAAHHFIFSQR
jgi:Ras-related protein Rab-7A